MSCLFSFGQIDTMFTSKCDHEFFQYNFICTYFRVKIGEKIKSQHENNTQKKQVETKTGFPHLNLSLHVIKF
jgi:hypothetical protein